MIFSKVVKFQHDLWLNLWVTHTHTQTHVQTDTHTHCITQQKKPLGFWMTPYQSDSLTPVCLWEHCLHCFLQIGVSFNTMVANILPMPVQLPLCSAPWASHLVDYRWFLWWGDSVNTFMIKLHGNESESCRTDVSAVSTPGTTVVD